MAELRCPNCGKNNPDTLDVCQFCQAPLKPQSTLRIGQTPTKKNTGELENVLPDWLKNVRQQARDSAEADAAAQAAARPESENNEPPDFLAGLTSQASSSQEDDVPDWLSRLNPAGPPEPLSPPAAPGPSADFFAQFNQNKHQPGPEAEPSEIESPSRAGLANGSSPERDELSDWFAKASEGSEETVELDADAQESDMGWGSSFGARSTPAEPSAPKEEEDLSWLHNLEATAKQTGDLQTPKQGTDWQTNFDISSTPSQPSGSGEDLSWLDHLGGIEEPKPGSEPPSSSENDLSWLDQFGGIPASSQSAQPLKPQEDLSWLDRFGAEPEPQPPASAPDPSSSSQPFPSEEVPWLEKPGATPEPSAFTPGASLEGPQEEPTSSEDLSWLNTLGTTTGATAAQDDLSWLNDLGGASEPSSAPPFSEPPADAAVPRQTAPLGQSAKPDEEPDWLKSAIEPPSMPAPGDLSMDWFTGAGQPADKKRSAAAPPPSPLGADIFSTPDQPPALSNKEVDSLFSTEMPDWLSQPEAESEESVSQQAGIPSASSDESLAPVDLPSWVQAMRPVETVISETSPGVADQPTETEGPLAGLQGVIPIAPIGSSRRPKAVSLKLQASDEQQASAALLEQILGTETSPRTLIASPLVAPQQWLRWTLTGLFLIVLSAAIFLRSQFMPVASSLPVDVSNISGALLNIPAGGNVLVIVDYEPSLAGEMEAVSAPLLDQMALLGHPRFSFLATSPNGTALIERLMSNPGINQEGSPYLNLGYLPGGATGVLGFMESPGQFNPNAGVQSLSDYSALVLLSDHAESGRVWVEQLQNQKQKDPALTNKPFLVAASAQAGPLLQPYVLSGQITGMISGISESARYESANNSRPGIARSYWDTFGIGLLMSIALIVAGSVWSLLAGIRTRRTEPKQG